jgi:AAA15 family ATPase/GTPase
LNTRRKPSKSAPEFKRFFTRGKGLKIRRFGNHGGLSSWKRMKNIQIFEHEILDCISLHESIMNNAQRHYSEKSYINGLPNSKANKRVVSFLRKNNTTFFDKLLGYV